MRYERQIEPISHFIVQRSTCHSMSSPCNEDPGAQAEKPEELNEIETRVAKVLYIRNGKLLLSLCTHTQAVSVSQHARGSISRTINEALLFANGDRERPYKD